MAADVSEPPAAQSLASDENNDDASDYIELQNPSFSAVASPQNSVPSISRLLKGKGREWSSVRTKPGPLHLLDLPMDILRLIVKEVTHTNDLTSLALTNSTMFNLAVPYIYARFDIVWPDSAVTTSEARSIDALTYGLSTLCLGSKFAQKARWLRGSAPEPAASSPRTIDNNYAKYTRKFSLGNGPADWVSEYMVTKESGKMLGTLVALAAAKMVNLETFVWDMPTGVLSDIFMSLASLRDHSPDGESKLEKVWVRWHDNSQTTSPPTTATNSPVSQPAIPALIPPGSHFPPIGPPITAPPDNQSTTRTISYSESPVEYPTFSILPPLKSLTVLDIDEIAYLDEMSMLIERSKDSLQELRVGISQKAHSHDFAQLWRENDSQQVDHDARWPGESKIGDKRLGGVLGVLFGRIYDIRRKSTLKLHQNQSSADLGLGQGSSPNAIFGAQWPHTSGSPPGPGTSAAQASLSERYPVASGSGTKPGQNNKSPLGGRKRLDGKLKLQTLELERIHLSLQVCSKALDWSILTSLAILECPNHEALWKMLRKQFAPTQPAHGSPPGTQIVYHLALKRIHADITTPSLISFLKETLAPNTLEVLFLQDRRRPATSVTVDTVFKAAVKRHRSSLKKLLLDSSEKKSNRNASSEGTRWRSWVLTSDMVSYITSGRMGNLKELAVAVDYKDWHPFLQRLPNMPHLRSLHIPHMLDPISGTFEPKELALQIVDIITLRQEIQLCYVGIGNRCFEILEARPTDNLGMGTDGNGVLTVTDVDDEDDEDGDDGSDGDDETEDEVNDEDTNASPTDADDEFTETSDDADSEADSFQETELSQSATRLRLREILFYDDKVAIFKARHGRL